MKSKNSQGRDQELLIEKANKNFRISRKPQKDPSSSFPIERLSINPRVFIPFFCSYFEES